MPSRAADRVDQIFCGEQICPFDWVNLPIFYYPRPEPGTKYTRRGTAQMKLLHVINQETTYGLRTVFAASAMSNGWPGHNLVNYIASTEERKNEEKNILALTERLFGKRRKTVMNMDTTVAGSELRNRVILPNREADFHAGNLLEMNFPELAAIYPIIFDPSIHAVTDNPAASQGATLQGWAFETFWASIVIRSSHFVYRGINRFDSRHLGVEDQFADMVQLGALDHFRDGIKPGKEYPVTDLKKVDVPLADRAWGRAKQIFERTEQDFITDLTVANILAEFAIDDWLRGKGQPVGFPPLDMDKIHPVLADRTPEELERMDRLKEMMLPYIAEKYIDMELAEKNIWFVPWLLDPNLKKYIEDCVLPAKGKFKDLDFEKMERELFSEKIIGDRNMADLYETEPEEALTGEFGRSASFRAPKRRDTDGRYFSKRAGLFDDKYRMFHSKKFDKKFTLSIRERAIARIILAGTEAARLPEANPRSLFYISKSKGGIRAKKYMEERGISYLKESYSAENQLKATAFAKQVIAENRKQIPKDVDAILASEMIKRRGIENVVSHENMRNIYDFVKNHPEIVDAHGADELSPEAELAIEMEKIDRQHEAVAVRKHWYVNHDEAQLTLRAVQIALGLVDRPYEGGKFKMELFEYDEETMEVTRQLDFYDLVMPFGKYVEENILDASPPPPAREHLLTLARLFQFLDMRMDLGDLNYRIVEDPKTGDKSRQEIILFKDAPFILDFWEKDLKKTGELKELRDRVREKLLEIGAREFAPGDLEGLHVEYESRWNRAHGFDDSKKAREFIDRQGYQKVEGPL